MKENEKGRLLLKRNFQSEHFYIELGANYEYEYLDLSFVSKALYRVS